MNNQSIPQRKHSNQTKYDNSKPIAHNLVAYATHQSNFGQPSYRNKNPGKKLTLLPHLCLDMSSALSSEKHKKVAAPSQYYTNSEKPLSPNTKVLNTTQVNNISPALFNSTAPIKFNTNGPVANNNNQMY